MSTTCPQCRQPIDATADDAVGTGVCPSCGAEAGTDPEATATWASRGDHRAIGRFEVIARVGSGSFGTVYQARDSKLDRVVAVKLPRAGDLADPQDLQRFLREARSVAQLRHPAIVPVHEVGEHDGRPFLVSDFVPGVTLADFLTARRPPPREAAELVAAVAEALQYAHERGVVHRDVKPSNIMIDGDGRPHVMDFGLAKRDAGEASVTLDGQVIGTPAYMSPEQAKGEGHSVDGRSDVYSLGVVLYRLLTGELPFRGNPRMLLHQVLHDEPDPPRKLNDRIPRDLETACLKAMQKEPGRRYATAGDLAADLRRFLAGVPIAARPVGRLERAWRWARRNRVVAALSAGLVVALVIVTADWLHAARLRARAESVSARMAFDRALASCDQGDANLGMIWMARALELASPGDADLRRVIRINMTAWRGHLAQVRREIDTGLSVPQIELGRDGRTALAVGRYSQGPGQSIFRSSVRPIDLDAGESSGPIRDAPESRIPPVLGPGGRTVVATDGDGGFRLYEALTGEPASPRLVHGSPVRQVAFRPDGRWVATVGSDGLLRVWEPARGRPVGPPLRHPGPVIGFRLLPDGRLLTACQDGGLRSWDPAAGRVERVILRPGGTWLPQIVDLTPDGQFLLLQRGHLEVWDLPRGTLQRALPYTAMIESGALSPDGRLIATTLRDGTLCFWDVATGAPVGPRLRHRGGATEVRPPLDGAINPARWGFADIDATSSTGLFLNFGSISTVRFRPDGRSLLTVSGGLIRMWEMPRTLGPGSRRPADPMQLPVGFYDLPGQVRLAMDVREPVSIGPTVSPTDDRLLGYRLFTADGSQPLGPAFLHPGGVAAASLSPDGRTVLTAGNDHTVRLWDGLLGLPLGPPWSYPSALASVAFEPDGRSAVVLCADKSAWAWDLPAPIEGNDEQVRLWARAVSGLEFGSRETVQVIDHASWLEARRRLQAEGGPPLVVEPSADDLLAWHIGAASAAAEVGQWPAVLWHLDALPTAVLADRSALWARGTARASLGRFREAAEDYAEALRRTPDSWYLGFNLAQARLAAGDLAGYRAACADLRKRHTRRDPAVLTRPLYVAWTCALGPADGADPSGPLSVVESTLRAAPQINRQDAVLLKIQSLALLRAGRPAEAIRRSEEAIALRPEGASPIDHLLLSLAHHHLGHRDEARRHLDLAGSAPGPDDPALTRWRDRLEIRLLRDEARSLLDSHRSASADRSRP